MTKLLPKTLSTILTRKAYKLTVNIQ